MMFFFILVYTSVFFSAVLKQTKIDQNFCEFTPSPKMIFREIVVIVCFMKLDFTLYENI